MPDVSFAWRTLGYVIIQVAALWVMEQVSKRRLPRILWRWVRLQVVVIAIASLAELVPYYLLGISMPHQVKLYKNIAVIVFLLIVLARYLLFWMKWKSNGWPTEEV